MSKPTTATKLYLKESNIANAGLGVFAKTDIEPFEILEECYFINLVKNCPNTSTLFKYTYYFSANRGLCIVFGFGMMYNHSLNPNVYWELDYNNRVMRFISNKSIKAGEELYINYQIHF